jgi:hypothetical protein
MRAVVQRVASASVEVDGAVVSRIGAGLLCLVGVGSGDTERDAEFLCVAACRLPGRSLGGCRLRSVTAPPPPPRRSSSLFIASHTLRRRRARAGRERY